MEDLANSLYRGSDKSKWISLLVVAPWGGIGESPSWKLFLSLAPPPLSEQKNINFASFAHLPPQMHFVTSCPSKEFWCHHSLLDTEYFYIVCGPGELTKNWLWEWLAATFYPKFCNIASTCTYPSFEKPLRYNTELNQFASHNPSLCGRLLLKLLQWVYALWME